MSFCLVISVPVLKMVKYLGSVLLKCKKFQGASCVDDIEASR